MNNVGLGCFKCGKVQGSIRGKIRKLSDGNTLADRNPEVIKIWSILNEKTPYEYAPHSHEIVYWKCLNNHKDYKQQINVKMMQGQGCPKCGKINMSKKSRKKYSEKFYYIVNENNHEVLTEYTLSHDPIVIDFKCGHLPHITTPHNYLAGGRCPKCTTSNGESIIHEYLDKMGEFYVTQLKLHNNRFYDIYLPKYNLIIEVHGLQHYEEVDIFQSTLEEVQSNDREKEEFAIMLGYDYMVIDYREHKPKKVLERFIHQFDKYKKLNKS